MTKFGQILKAKKIKLSALVESTGLSEAYLNELATQSLDKLTVKEATLLATAIRRMTDGAMMNVEDFLREVKPELIKTPPALKSSKATTA
jgi:DNA-binding Xre family transcriptional regulator